MEESVLKIIREHDDFAYKAEIKENAKGEAQISITVRSDVSAKDAGDKALVEYKRMSKELTKK